MKAICKRINVDGTNLILSLCIKHSIERLVYTSSYNVVFSRHELINVTEEVPYPEDKEQYDWYSRTKKAAEKAVLAANGTILGKSKSNPPGQVIQFSLAIQFLPFFSK